MLSDVLYIDCVHIVSEYVSDVFESILTGLVKYILRLELYVCFMKIYVDM